MTENQEQSLSVNQRQYRRFSESFKRKKVQEIELKVSRISEICKQYQVSSVAVYKWIRLYGINKHSEERLIMETKSDTTELLRLKQKVAELERLIGQKQIELDFKNKMIEIAEQMYGIDIKKKLSTPPSDISGSKDIK
ncbi:MAG: transposase [Agriterribacter sp.]